MLNTLLDLDHLAVVGHEQHQRMVLQRLFLRRLIIPEHEIERQPFWLYQLRRDPAVGNIHLLRDVVEDDRRRYIRLDRGINRNLHHTARVLERKLNLLLTQLYHTGFHRRKERLTVKPVLVLIVPVENHLHASIALDNDAVSGLAIHHSVLLSTKLDAVFVQHGINVLGLIPRLIFRCRTGNKLTIRKSVPVEVFDVAYQSIEQPVF